MDRRRLAGLHLSLQAGSAALRAACAAGAARSNLDGFAQAGEAPAVHIGLAGHASFSFGALTSQSETGVSCAPKPNSHSRMNA